jgi:hypothetical protein
VVVSFGFFLRLLISCPKPARTEVQAERSEFIVRAWTPAAAGFIENPAGEGKIMFSPYAAAIHVTGAGTRYPSELCGRTVL